MIGIRFALYAFGHDTTKIFKKFLVFFSSQKPEFAQMDFLVEESILVLKVNCYREIA